MSQTVITTAFEALKAQQAAANSPVVLDEFVFANVPNLNITDPIDPTEALPTNAQIVHRATVSKTGVVNANAVVYSVTLGADIGDFSFNWVGLRDKANNTLAMIVHAPVQQKVKNNAGTQGNVLTRSFLMEYDGAKKETQITTPAATWQIDFTARLAGMDERHRLENLDVYGSGAFIGDGFLVKRSGNNYSVTAGAGYVGGLRAVLAAEQALTVATKPVKVWVDTCFTGTLTSVWQVSTVFTVAETLADYVKNDVNHYVFAVAQINADGSVTDLRPNARFLRQDQNLKDVPDKAMARTALELKSAAQRDVGTASGNVLEVGAFGIGVGGKSYLTNFDWQTYTFVGGEYLYVDASTMKNTPSDFLFPAAAFLELFTIGLSDNDSPTVLAVAAGHMSEFAPTKLTCSGAKGSRSWRVNFLFEGTRDLGTTNINDLQKTWHVGIYGQATTRTGLIEQGYPVNEAGTLIVMPSAGGIVTQEYVTWQSRRRFVRSVNFDGTWRTWLEYAINGNDVSFRDITATSNLNVPNGHASVGTDLTVGRNARVVGDTALQGKLDVTKGVASSEAFSLNPKESNPFRMTNELLNFNGMVLVAAHACSWYNDGMAWGARRSGSTTIDGWTIFYNGKNIFNVGVNGVVTTSLGTLSSMEWVQSWVGGNFCSIPQRDAINGRLSAVESGYIRGIRFGAVESAIIYNALGFDDALGYVITGVVNNSGGSGSGPDNVVDYIKRRPLQININGSWMNVGG